MSKAVTSTAYVRLRNLSVIFSLAFANFAVLVFFFLPLSFVTRSPLAREHFGSVPEWIFWALFGVYAVGVLYICRQSFPKKAS